MDKTPNMIIDKTGLPGKRTGLKKQLISSASIWTCILIIILILKARPERTFLVTLIGMRLYLFGYIIGLSVIFSMIMHIWQKRMKVVYVRDKIRRGIVCLQCIAVLFSPLLVSALMGDELFTYITEDFDLTVNIMIYIIFLIPLALVNAACILFTNCGFQIYSEMHPGSYGNLTIGGGDHGSGHVPSTQSVEDESNGHNGNNGWKVMTDDYYGHRGEFDTNDRIRSHMEDMEQMSSEDGFDPEEHGYDWDEISDARNDGYI